MHKRGLLIAFTSKAQRKHKKYQSCLAENVLAFVPPVVDIVYSDTSNSINVFSKTNWLEFCFLEIR